jgi:acetyl esterase/lipase
VVIQTRYGVGVHSARGRAAEQEERSVVPDKQIYVPPTISAEAQVVLKALIEVGTKEMLLSSSVRFYQALEAAGQSVKLDVHEGMWHALPQHGLPESKVAVEKSAKFINDHLHPVNVVIQEKGIVR